MRRISANRNFTTGFSLFEVMIAMAIIAVLAGFIYSGFSVYFKKSTLDANYSAVRSLLNFARSESLSAKNASDFGVHFDSTSATLFQGSAYSLNDPNNIRLTVTPYVSISAINLGGGSDVVFGRLRGSADHSGTVVLSLVGDSSRTKTITIYGTGVVE